MSALETNAEELRQEKARLQSILENAPDPVIVIDQRGVVQSFNAAAFTSFGYAPEEVVGRNVSMLMDTPDREAHDAHLAHYSKTGERRIIGIGREVTARRKDGSHFPARLAVSEAKVGGQIYFTGFLHDLSEQKEAETALYESEVKLREIQGQLYHAARHGEIGEMASAIAHELNQPLTAIVNYVHTIQDLVADTPDLPSRATDFLDRTAAQAERAGLIIRRLRQLYERGEAETAPDDLNAAVKEALDLALIGVPERGVAVTVDLEPDLPDVWIDRPQIQQVVMNLVRNAAEALDDSNRKELTITTRLGEEETVELAVTDSGPGIAPDIAANLFSPFQTTKSQGMGLGLSICHSIVEGHGGRISASPNPGGGTTFLVSLTLGRLTA